MSSEPAPGKIWAQGGAIKRGPLHVVATGKARTRWPRFPVTCTVCKKLRYCTPCFPTTKEERAEMARTYVCTDHTQSKKVNES